eukprot:NODE_2206_length_976_cov_249.294245.p1 GENE.NODE_2206_length_976_cov_249.294245~~NODE_2206_length_976_cov_249.294245.p1  ORF type:complete len:191 (-),score=47.14 NODE_2206_length_976_cov_249.294245:386-958(-)
MGKANRIMKLDLENVRREEQQKKKKWQSQLQQIFAELDGGKTETGMMVMVTPEMFRDSTRNNRMQVYLRRIGLRVDESNSDAIFRVMDTDQEGVLQLDDMQLGLESLASSARQLDVHRLLQMMKGYSTKNVQLLHERARKPGPALCAPDRPATTATLKRPPATTATASHGLTAEGITACNLPGMLAIVSE